LEEIPQILNSIEEDLMKIEEISKILNRNLLLYSVILRVNTWLMMNFP